MGLSYATSIDMWSVGCIFAELFLRKALFAGNYEMDQLAKIFEVIGTPTAEEWPENAALTRSNFATMTKKDLNEVIPELDEHGKDILEVSTRSNDFPL